MGNCCSWKTSLENRSELYMKVENYPIDNYKILNHDKTTNMFKISSIIHDKNYPEFLTNQENLSRSIHDLILSSNNNKINTINRESLWNITKYYGQDFTQSSYILYDLRKKEKKQENFLKKYKCINYNINEIQTFSGNKLHQFKNFIRNKNIIIIPQNENSEFKKISNFIELLSDENFFQQKFYILTDILNMKDEDIPQYLLNYKLYKKIDDKDFEIYPNILFSLSDIKYLNNYNYIFIQKKEHKPEYYTSNEEFMAFLNIMQIKVVIDIDDNYSSNAIYDKGEILYVKINYKGYKNCNNCLKNFIYYLRFAFLSQGALLIFYSDTNEKELSKWISFILCNSFFIYDEEGIMLTESEFLSQSIQSMTPLYFNNSRFVEETLMIDIEEICSNKDYSDDNFDSEQSEINQSIRNLWDEKKEKNIFFEIICVLEKLLLNIILNPGNDKFYKIKKSSRTIQNFITNIPEANFLFQSIGFKSDEKNEFYTIDKNFELSNIEYFHKCLIYAVNKMINGQEY